MVEECAEQKNLQPKEANCFKTCTLGSSEPQNLESFLNFFCVFDPKSEKVWTIVFTICAAF